MNNISKLIVFLVICLGLWWGYDKFFSGKVQTPPKEPVVSRQEKVPEVTPEQKPEEQKPEEQEKEDSYIYVYLLTTDKSGAQFMKPVKRPLAPGKDKITQAVTMLLSGPNNIEASSGIYTEIPEDTKLISITTSDDKVIINLSSSFALGGGSDSTYARMRQLIKTVLVNTDKPVYLHLDGKQAEIIGGEGITVTQPLSEKSLDE